MFYAIHAMLSGQATSFDIISHLSTLTISHVSSETFSLNQFSDISRCRNPQVICKILDASTQQTQGNTTLHHTPYHNTLIIPYYSIIFHSSHFNSIQFRFFLLCFLTSNIYCCRYDGFLFIKITLFNNKCKLNIKLISGNTRKKKRNTEKNCYYGSKKKNHEVN